MAVRRHHLERDGCHAEADADSGDGHGVGATTGKWVLAWHQCTVNVPRIPLEAWPGMAQ